MKSSVYQIVGCAGSLKLREVETVLDAATAARHARQRNQTRADGLGLSMRAYRQRSEGCEGWHFSARGGRDGYAHGVAS